MDCMQLFSSRVKSLATPMRLMTLNMAKAKITLVMPTPRVHPVLAPTYRLVRDSTLPIAIPVTAERTVSCGMSPL